MRKLCEVLLTLMEYTTPTPHEHRVAHLLPEGTEKDAHGNYVLNVGDHGGVMFSSHLDTADSGEPKKVAFRVSSDGRLSTDGTTILGADCRTGAALMICMAERNIPGHYVWHFGEERGGIGSRARARTEAEWYKANIKMCVALDRKEYGSIITQQGGTRTCSDEFANSLAAEIGYSHIDTGGSFTDSKSYCHLIPECTNLSVGYHNAHGNNEWQSLPYVHWLLERLCQTKWKDLVISRTPQEETRQYSGHTFQGGYSQYGQGLWSKGKEEVSTLDEERIQPQITEDEIKTCGSLSIKLVPLESDLTRRFIYKRDISYSTKKETVVTSAFRIRHGRVMQLLAELDTTNTKARHYLDKCQASLIRQRMSFVNQNKPEELYERGQGLLYEPITNTLFTLHNGKFHVVVYDKPAGKLVILKEEHTPYRASWVKSATSKTVDLFATPGDDHRERFNRDEFYG